MQNGKSERHNKYAPYWALALVVLLALGLSTLWLDPGKFWRGYLLDMVGPAWSYILFRGLFTAKIENAWTRFFTPNRTLGILLAVCLGIEILQYFNLYHSTFDPLDLLAYSSIIALLYAIDRLQGG